VADLMNWDTICGRFNGLGYYLWQILRAINPFVADLMCLNVAKWHFSGVMAYGCTLYNLQPT